MTEDWSLKGRGITCCGDIPLTITGQHTVYQEEVIETLRQKLIADFCEEFVYPESETAKEIINKRFGVE